LKSSHLPLQRTAMKWNRHLQLLLQERFAPDTERPNRKRTIPLTPAAADPPPLALRRAAELDGAMRKQIVISTGLIVLGLAVLLCIPTAYEGPLLLYINPQHAIRLVDAIGLAIAVPAWFYLCWLTKKLLIWSVYLVTLGSVVAFRKQIYPSDGASFLLAITLMAGGSALAVMGKRALGSAHTTLPEARYLVTHGIYSKIRHPIYVGVQLIYWGLSLWFRSWPGFILTLVLLLPFHFWRAWAEERVLSAAFGEAYEQYKKRTLF